MHIILHLQHIRHCSTETGRIAAKQPFQVTLVPGKTYFWCRCGLSKKQVLRGSLVPRLSPQKQRGGGVGWGGGWESLLLQGVHKFH